MKQFVFQLIILMMTGFSLSSCNDDKPKPTTKEVPLVIFDTDVGSSTDDLFALEMLYRYHDAGLCRLLGVVVDREGEEYAACADVICAILIPPLCHLPLLSRTAQ